ncbi:MAG: thymidine phosphorylase [Deltaproteobacteria bacterium]|nr:thymidine phosphorylase [Deltaproteobacteria bacterium]
MQAKEIITRKREGAENSKDELDFLLKGFLKGEVKEYQLSAWLMAVFFRGMSDDELSVWTQLMWHSGTTLLRKPTEQVPHQYWIDKHSTGGVGDKISLVLVPLVRKVCEQNSNLFDIRIPMVSGRGLGHTGGTLDKLESVSGFKTRLETDKALKLLQEQGFFMIGQTEAIAPADRLLYSLRDVTGTIESIPLIVSSIMSKKLSENLNGIVFDVKTGLGAFMPELEKAKLLAKGLLAVAKKQGLDAVAILSQMDEPLGNKVGNFLEVEECADFLKGLPSDPDFTRLVVETASWMVHLGSKQKVSLDEAEKQIEEFVRDGVAYPLFVQMLESQGGDYRKFEFERETFRKEYLALEFRAKRSGILTQMNARQLGVLLVDLGGGRAVKEADIDPKVGFEILKKVGSKVNEGETLIRVYFRKYEESQKIEEMLQKAVIVESLSNHHFEKKCIVREIMT